MCGILGFSHADENKLRKTLGFLKHRGPDDFGVFVREGVSFGHCRLSILDLTSAAKQPMTIDGGNLVLVFNGEIYNFFDLKKDLLGKGHVFKGTGDTEVILQGYKEYGMDFFSKMRGMWALAIYDKLENKIILARDYFSIKPLYYAIENEILYFGSEIKSLAPLLAKREPNKESYYHFFNLGYFVGPETCFKNIKKLRSGEILTWKIDRRTLSQSHVSLLPVDQKTNYVESFGEAVSLVDQVLRNSVLAHYIADVPVGLLLSGGNDSSLLAALSVAQGQKPVVYNLNIQNSTDSHYARKVSQCLGLDFVQAEMPESSLENQYEKIWEFLDEPTADYSIIPTSLIYSCIAGKAKVVLSGEGGDELFGGYMRHNKLAGLTRVFESNLITQAFNSLSCGNGKLSLKYLNPLLNRTRNLILDNLQNDLVGSYLAKTKLIDFPFKDEAIRKLLVSQFYSINNPNLKNPNSLFFDRFLYLPNDLMYKNDVASMAYSIEARVPFLDKMVLNTVISGVKPEFCLSPQHLQKTILKKVMEKYLPEELIYRPKKGFSFSFAKYAFKSFRSDFQEALTFHAVHADVFDLVESKLLKVLSPQHAELLIKKYPGLAFALVSNWKIFKNLI